MSNIITSNMNEKLEPTPSRTWLSGAKESRRSVIMVLPTKFAQHYHLEDPTNILLTPTDKGILISKLELSNNVR